MLEEILRLYSIDNPDADGSQTYEELQERVRQRVAASPPVSAAWGFICSEPGSVGPEHRVQPCAARESLLTVVDRSITVEALVEETGEVFAALGVM